MAPVAEPEDEKEGPRAQRAEAPRPVPGSGADRAARLARALRENLRRRKEQARARARPAGEPRGR